MATIRQRNNRWQVTIKRKGYPVQYNTFDLKRDAEKWARQQERLIDTGQWIDRTETEQTTFAEVLDRYGREVTPLKRGKDIEVLRIAALKQQPFSKLAMASINAQTIAAWRDSRLTRVSSSTVAREMQLLSHVFSMAIREWGFALPSNPVRMVRKPVGMPSRDRVLTEVERTKLVESLSSCGNVWVKPVVVFALETAARRGEILALQWKDIDLDRATAKLSVTKTGLPRTIPLSSACVRLLCALPRSMDGRVFPISASALQQAYRRGVKRAAINDFTFHDLRHDALTRLAKLGLSILELRAISGHTTANMLQRYVSIDPAELARKIA